jgi:hypothetical protein
MKYLAMAVCIFVFQSTTHQPSAHPQTKKSDSIPFRKHFDVVLQGTSEGSQ